METGIRKKLEDYDRRAMISHPEASPEVLRFITNFVTHKAGTEAEYEVIRSTFRAGYCWHFAHMLKSTFDRGEVCWAAPYGHFVWVDDNGVPYDVEGINEGDQYYNIPERYLGQRIADFTHIPGAYVPRTTKEDIIAIIRRYEDDNGLEHQKIHIWNIEEEQGKEEEHGHTGISD